MPIQYGLPSEISTLPKITSPGLLQCFENHRVVVGIDIFDNPEDALFDVGGHHLAVFLTQVGDIVTDDRLSGQHRGRCLAAGRRERTGEVGLAAVGAVDTHDEHVLGQPAFFRGLLDCQTQRQLFQADGVTGVLGIGRVNHVVFQVDIHAAFVHIDAAAVGVGFALRVQEAEELAVRRLVLNCS